MELLESRRVLASTFAHQVIDLPLDGRSGVAMEVADLNSDGLDDLIIGTGIGTVDVLFRDGDTFSNVQSLTVGGFVRSLTFADLDGDGRNADLVASTSEGLFFLLDQGSLDGSWQGYRLAGSTPQNNSFRVEVANLNGDAIDDLVYGVGVGFERDLSTQLGSGVDEEGNLSFGEPLTWQLRHKGSFVTVGVNDFDVGDVNQDGVDDIVATTPDVLIGVGLGGVNGSVFILTNDLQGGFDEQQFDGFAGAVNLFDFDLDGHLDILAGQPQQGQDAGGSVLYLGLGNSEFQRQGEIGGYDRITDGAGMRAYAVATISDHAFLTPGGLLLESYDTRTGAVTGDIRIGVQPWVSGGKPFFSDFDGDTSPVVIGLAETSLIVVRQAEPSILLSTEELSLTHDFISRSHASVHYGDFDADGYVDVLTMHERLGELKPAIRWGSPRGLTGPVDANFAETGFQLAGGFETRVEPEDGHPDILVNAMYGGEQGAVILEGSDDRTFSFRFDPGTILGKKDTLVAFGDIDGDGLMDRVSSLESSNRILLAQRGLHSDIDIEMQFDEGVHYKTEIEIGGDFTVSLGSQLSLADVTGDGVLDVLHTTNSSHVSVLPGISPFQPGDVNRDDVLDATDISILTANQDADVSSLYRLDMTGDQIVNQNDVDHWLESIVGTRRGDLDLDGDVDFADFLTLSANFGATEAVWSDGDFDGDGVVAFADFLVLSANFGFDRDIGE